MAFIILSLSYVSGYLLFFDLESITNEGYARFYMIQAIINVVDFTRYLPQLMHIAMVTSFYNTFYHAINCLRNELNIPSRKKETCII